ncbi:MAG TPA: hypothetical protein P5116_04630 [Eubacteriales bacterium]|jgi:hypothetical protein|nr:hypothetical protein [Clostridia bacterium]HRV73145.1 hypothetical protein [Eubacteriales bacterium]
MRCSCQICGTYMVQDEKGTQSRCVCPECFNTCSLCMGTGNQPLDPDKLKLAAQRRELEREREESVESYED